MHKHCDQQRPGEYRLDDVECAIDQAIGLDTLDLTPGALVWLPRRSRRQFAAGADGLRYLTVHQRHKAVALDLQHLTLKAASATPRLWPSLSRWPSHAGSIDLEAKMTELQRLYDEQGHSPWLDNLTRPHLCDGTPARLVDNSVIAKRPTARMPCQDLRSTGTSLRR